MNSSICFVVVIFFALAPLSSANAGTVTGKVSAIQCGTWPGAACNVFLDSSNADPGGSGCADSGDFWGGYSLALDGTSSTNTLAMLLAAEEAGITVTVVGAGTCVYYNPHVEDIGAVTF